MTQLNTRSMKNAMIIILRKNYAQEMKLVLFKGEVGVKAAACFVLLLVTIKLASLSLNPTQKSESTTEKVSSNAIKGQKSVRAMHDHPIINFCSRVEPQVTEYNP